MNLTALVRLAVDNRGDPKLRATEVLAASGKAAPVVAGAASE